MTGIQPELWIDRAAAATEILPESLAEYIYPSGPAWHGGMP
jgi:hypothetical protein